MTPQKQQGLSLSGLLMWSVVLVFVAILGMKVVPVYIENSTIQKNLNAIVNDADLQNASARQLRQAFIKRAQIDNISAVTAKDIVVSKANGKPVLAANYIAQVPLVSNVSLHFNFETMSE